MAISILLASVIVTVVASQMTVAALTPPLAVAHARCRALVRVHDASRSRPGRTRASHAACCHIQEAMRQRGDVEAGQVARRRPSGAWQDYALTLGIRLQQLRVARGLSQEQVAYAAGLSRYTYQKFEKGQSMPGTPANPSLRNIMAIAQILDVHLDQIVPEPWPDLHVGAQQPNNP